MFLGSSHVHISWISLYICKYIKYTITLQNILYIVVLILILEREIMNLVVIQESLLQSVTLAQKSLIIPAY